MSRTDENKPYWYKCPYCKKLFHERVEAEGHIKASHSKAIKGTGSRRPKTSSFDDYQVGASLG